MLFLVSVQFDINQNIFYKKYSQHFEINRNKRNNIAKKYTDKPFSFFGNKRKHYIYIYIPNAKKTIPKNIISFSIHPILIISSSTTNIIKNVSKTITINNQYRREAQTKPTIPPMQMRITTPNQINNKNSNNTKNKK